MVITRTQTENKGMFYAEQDGTIVAQLSYSVPSLDKMILEHTEVNNTMRAKELADD
jgi:uncharacterized protein